MIDSIKASQAGLSIVDQARRKKRWNKTAEVWCSQAFTSRATLSRFWAGQSIRTEMFMAICEAVGVDWQIVAESEMFSIPIGQTTTSASSAPEIYQRGENHDQDWGEAPGTQLFYGRETELLTLQQWIIQDNCRLAAILGMGGIGKTALVTQFARSHQAQFEFVIWRSLRHAPNLEALLTDLLQFFSESAIEHSTNLENQLLQVLKFLQAHRCLLILDGVETILPSSSTTFNTFRQDDQEGYREYQKFFDCLGESDHASCLILTSREMPQALAHLEGEKLPVRCLSIGGLSSTAGQQVIQTRGQLVGSEADWAELIDRYAGNPLILKLVTATIRDLFGSQIAPFLVIQQHSPFLLHEVQQLLTEQIDRLSLLEQNLLYWLNLHQKPMTLAELQEGLTDSIALSELMQAIAHLQQRTLLEITIESKTNHIMQQSILLKYTTNPLIQQMSWPLSQNQNNQQFILCERMKTLNLSH